MKLAQSVRVGVWLLIGMNLLMALGAIGVFTRMAPAIEVIIARNERSLQACEEMLASLALLVDDEATNKALQKAFTEALGAALGNITEKEEPAALQAIEHNYLAAFQGDRVAREKAITAITQLGRINREAMRKADTQAQEIGYAGAWGVVFMAVSVFFASMLFKRGLSRSLVRPLEEIHDVISAHRNGDTLRRCAGSDLPRDVKTVFNDLNDFLDRTQSQKSTFKNVLG